ncbi:MAG: hypothetical protein AB4038_00360 [Prochloraceae cyanobacterium]
MRQASVEASYFPPMPPTVQDYFWSYSASSGFAHLSGTNTRSNLVATQANYLLPKEYMGTSREQVKPKLEFNK